MNKIKREKGITLVALVITIAVLLILAGVSIGSILGDDGLIKRSQEAKERSEEHSRNEELERKELYNALVGDKTQNGGTSGSQSGGTSGGQGGSTSGGQGGSTSGGQDGSTSGSTEIKKAHISATALITSTGSTITVNGMDVEDGYRVGDTIVFEVKITNDGDVACDLAISVEKKEGCKGEVNIMPRRIYC